MHFLLVLLLTLQHLCWGLRAQESPFKYDITDANHTILNAETITKPGCPKKCGNLTVPYPFGIISDGLSCSKDSSLDITCNYSTNPPKAFIKNGNLQVYDISNSELRISNLLAYRCYNSGVVTSSRNIKYSRLTGTPYMYSEANVLTTVGCDDLAYLYSSEEGYLPKGCITTCQDTDEVPDNECSGSGCCQVSINLQQFYRLSLVSFYKHSNVSSFSSCGYAFYGEKRRFNFKGISDLQDPGFLNRTTASVPIVLDWVIGNKSCTEVDQDSNSKACGHENTYCINGTRSGGYRCSCKDGYEGNPYLSPGCKDINECEQPTHGCQHHCNNTPGRYNCSCRPGYDIDVHDITKCIPKSC